jgi:hypothetical protein
MSIELSWREADARFLMFSKRVHLILEVEDPRA